RRHAGGARERPAPTGFDLGPHFAELVGGGASVVGKVLVRPSDAETRDVGALGRQSERRRPADAPPPRRAGHQSDFPCDACQRHEVPPGGRVTTRRMQRTTSVLYWWSRRTL